MNTKKYYIGEGNTPLTEINSLKQFDNIAEAETECKLYQNEVLSGVYDEEYGLKDEAERRSLASDVYVYRLETTPAGAIRQCKRFDFPIDLLRTYIVEYAEGENFTSVKEWYSLDGLESIHAENPEEAAKVAACTNGLENKLFKVREVVLNDLEEMEKVSDPMYFTFTN